VDDEHAPIADALGDPPLLPCAMEEPLQAIFPQEEVPEKWTQYTQIDADWYAKRK